MNVDFKYTKCIIQAMTLYEYIYSFQPCDRTAIRRWIADALGISEVYVRSMSNGTKPLLDKHAIKIEELTNNRFPDISRFRNQFKKDNQHMRIFGSVQTCFWQDTEIQQLSDHAKLLAIYLLTCPHSNMIGAFRLPDGYITEDLRWDGQVVRKTFQELSEIHFLTRDEKNGWLIVHDFLKWNPIQNPKQGIGIQKLFELVPSDSLVTKPLINGLLTYGKYLNQEFEKRLLSLQENEETLFHDHVADKEQDKDKEQNKIYMLGSSIDEKNSQKKILHSQAIEVLEFLNEKAGRVYRPVDANLKLIIARLSSGATTSECFQVIAKKTREWKGNPIMAEYLRPATLFNAIKFEQYVGELVLTDKSEAENEA